MVFLVCNIWIMCSTAADDLVPAVCTVETCDHGLVPTKGVLSVPAASGDILKSDSRCENVVTLVMSS